MTFGKHLSRQKDCDSSLVSSFKLVTICGVGLLQTRSDVSRAVERRPILARVKGRTSNALNSEMELLSVLAN